MNNYYIDASVYAYPFNEETQDEEYIENLAEYIDKIEILDDVINFNKPFHVKYFLSYRDIIFLGENNLDLTEIGINELTIDRNVKMGLKIAQENLEKIYCKIFPDPDPEKSNKASKYIDFDEWFMISNLEFNSEPVISKDISMFIKNEQLRTNTKKNMAIIAALNKYVYKTYENNDVFSLILNNDISLNNIQINADFTVNMFHFFGFDKDNKEVRYIYKLKDFPKHDFIQIINQNVNFSKIDVLTKKYIYSWNDDHNAFIEKAKKEFEHIEFDSNCAIELEQYRRKIDVKQQEIKEEKQLDKIKEWKSQFYDVLYANLKALNNFLNINNRVGNIDENERYHGCRYGCDRMINCGAHIRYFGVDCVDEKEDDKEKDGVEEDRTINKKKFWLHLRPYNIPCDDPLWFLALRIHFRWITNRTIEIGSIGRHRYLPCDTVKNLPNCKRHARSDSPCPLHPSNYDKNLNVLQNFCRQFQTKPLSAPKTGHYVDQETKMKVVVVTVPMRPPDEIKAVVYPVNNGDKTLEYGKPIRFPISSILANVFKKDEKVRVIFIMTASENSNCEQNKQNIIRELEGINADIGAILSYDTVEIGFEASNKAYDKLITDLADKIPDNAELYTDITYGFKTEVISLICALRFAEEFRNSIVQYIVYGKVEFRDKQPENPEFWDITSLYYLFKLMGKIGATDAESAMKILKDFFAL